MQQKALFSVVLTGLMVMAFTFAAIPAAPAADVINLTYSVFFPPTHAHAIAADSMAKEIEKRTNGRVKITVFAGGTLTKPDVCYDGVVKGISDLGQSAFAYTMGRFPIMEAVDMPFGYPNGKSATRIAYEFYKKMNPKELQDVKVLAIHAHGPGVLAAKKDVNSLEELKGLKIRCTGLSLKIAEALGAVPVAMPQNAAYEALQKGVVEGTLCPIETLKGWKQGEVIDYVIESKALSYTTAMFVVMNKKKYDALPPDIQKIFDDVGAEWVDVHGNAWDEADKAGRDFVTGLKKPIHGLAADQEAQWTQAVQPMFADYQVRMEKQGLPGKDAVDALKELAAKYGK